MITRTRSGGAKRYSDQVRKRRIKEHESLPSSRLISSTQRLFSFRNEIAIKERLNSSIPSERKCPGINWISLRKQFFKSFDLVLNSTFVNHLGSEQESLLRISFIPNEIWRFSVTSNWCENWVVVCKSIFPSLKDKHCTYIQVFTREPRFDHKLRLKFTQHIKQRVSLQLNEYFLRYENPIRKRSKRMDQIPLPSMDESHFRVYVQWKPCASAITSLRISHDRPRAFQPLDVIRLPWIPFASPRKFPRKTLYRFVKQPTGRKLANVHFSRGDDFTPLTMSSLGRAFCQSWIT